MTDTDREYISGEGDATEHQRQQSVTRVRSRIQDEIPRDIQILQKHRLDLLDELREVVCQDADSLAEDIGQAIERWQKKTPTQESTEALVYVAPIAEPGYLEFTVEADEEEHPAKFLNRLESKIDLALHDNESYKGHQKGTVSAGVFLDDVAVELFSDLSADDMRNLETIVDCPNCGESVDAADAFCRYCGREI